MRASAKRYRLKVFRQLFRLKPTDGAVVVVTVYMSPLMKDTPEPLAACEKAAIHSRYQPGRGKCRRLRLSLA